MLRLEPVKPSSELERSPIAWHAKLEQAIPRYYLGMPVAKQIGNVGEPALSIKQHGEQYLLQSVHTHCTALLVQFTQWSTGVAALLKAYTVCNFNWYTVSG